MPTSTHSPRPGLRRQRSATRTTPRFGTGRGGRQAPSRSPMPRRRPGKHQSSGLAGLVGGLTAKRRFGRSKAKPASSANRGRKGAGLALATAAAGWAVSNRDRIGAMLKRDKQQDAATPPAPAAPLTDHTDTPPPATT